MASFRERAREGGEGGGAFVSCRYFGFCFVLFYFLSKMQVLHSVYIASHYLGRGGGGCIICAAWMEESSGCTTSTYCYCYCCVRRIPMGSKFYQNIVTFFFL